ncbi:MAG: hypothetical protein NTW52_06125 [Planctomycetota bacterium]|nr:hypothetical protein [Planctomycetota bacterium]
MITTLTRGVFLLMSDNPAEIDKGNCFGFVTVRLHPEHGYFGGLLVVNSLARPLEFHCTLPVKPNRAQSILYGPTLDDFVCGEQIARALLAKSKSKPVSIFTDTSAVLSVRHFISIPIGWIETESKDNEQSALVIPVSSSNRSYRSNRVDDTVVQVPEAFLEDGQIIATTWKKLAPQIDLMEPFGRITEALFEANPAAKAA